MIFKLGYVYVKCMENTSVIFCIRNGGLFRDQKKELETIVTGEGKEDFPALPVWNFLHCSPAHLYMAKILQSGSDIFPQTCSFMVSCKYIYLCDPVISCFLLPEKK